MTCELVHSYNTCTMDTCYLTYSYMLALVSWIHSDVRILLRGSTLMVQLDPSGSYTTVLSCIYYISRVFKFSIVTRGFLCAFDSQGFPMQAICLTRFGGFYDCSQVPKRKDDGADPSTWGGR